MDDGAIVPNQNDPIALYMWVKLKLYLKRYAIYWRLELLFENLERLQCLRESKWQEDDQNEINRAIADLDKELIGYLKYLGTNHNDIV
jgi:hypothetical protein